MRKVQVLLPEVLHKKIKHIAVDSDRSINAVMQECVEYWIEKKVNSSLTNNDNLTKL
jgi:hypothetical protein